MARNGDIALTLVRTIRAPVEKVYAAWTDPAIAARWFAPGQMTARVDFDARVGGRYRVEMTDPGGGKYIVGGEYRELIPNRKLVKTWRWEDSDTDTLLTVDFAEKDGATELTLTHQQFRDDEMRGKHVEGWTSCLARLEQMYA